MKAEPASWYDLLRFAGAWAALSLVPYLPPLLSPLSLSPYFPLQVEVLVLVTLAVLTARTRWHRAGRLLATTGVFAVFLYQVYDAVVYASFQRSGLLYEDVQYVVDLAYLAADFSTGASLGTAVLALLGAAGLAVAVPRLVAVAAQSGRSRPTRWLLLAVHAVTWTLVGVVAPAQEWGTENLTYQSGNERTRVRTVTAKAAANARASLRLRTLLDTLDQAPVDSAYYRYRNADLPRRPHVILYMIESYGEVLARHPDLRAPYRGMMDRVEDSLTADGWHAATGVSDAPVRGGRSWLAIASVLLGTRIEHQVLYERFRNNPGTQPHLVRFLDRRGYRTVTLQPYTVERPGLPVTNHYGFDAELYRDDLAYTGPEYGWGIVPMPDQYSLGVAHDRYLRDPDAPTFLFFETVFSHALWNYGLPPVVPDWRDFNAVTGTDAEKKQALADRAVPGRLLPDSLTTPRIFDQPTPARFLRHIGYEVEVAQQFLLRDAPPNTLVILMGDHPPPLLATDTFGVPVHVLSRDSTLLQPFRRHGFRPGLHLEASSPDAAPPDAAPSPARSVVHRRASAAPVRRWTHEGLFSLIAHALAYPDTTHTPLRPTGVPPSILAQ